MNWTKQTRKKLNQQNFTSEKAFEYILGKYFPMKYKRNWPVDKYFVDFVFFDDEEEPICGLELNGNIHDETRDFDSGRKAIIDNYFPLLNLRYPFDAMECLGVIKVILDLTVGRADVIENYERWSNFNMKLYEFDQIIQKAKDSALKARRRAVKKSLTP